MIHKLESAGLGYHVKADESEDRLGKRRFIVGFLDSFVTVSKNFVYKLRTDFEKIRVLTNLLITGGALFRKIV